ncbi:MAG TPA: SDR family NAD(P)-dependent oxidoreductase [Pseudonocardiaceae bacterium]|jgi:NAD(P)-dependent dehydrogenase (short-subunit alcohol dehydrogenase family)|nr:SDR family NAD(P)-dependent oxidoreductase [Pseudonocardiaceae bacterium]
MSTATTQPELAGSVALVTGGGRGIGRVLALALAGAGAAVGLIARSSDQLAESVQLIEAAGGLAAAASADLSDPDATATAVKTVRDELGPVDLLVNNAGIGGPVGPAWEVREEQWWRTVEVNLRGVALCSRLVLPEMVGRRRGRIVNLTSEAGVFRWPLASAYSVSKAAVIKFTENLGYETRRYGISVFSVHPGLVPIGLSGAALADTASADSPHGRLNEWVRQEFAAGRGAEPHQVAELLLRIATGEVDRLSGRHLSVHDDLDTLLARTEDLLNNDLYVLRLRNLPSG